MMAGSSFQTNLFFFFYAQTAFSKNVKSHVLIRRLQLRCGPSLYVRTTSTSLTARAKNAFEWLGSACSHCHDLPVVQETDRVAVFTGLHIFGESISRQHSSVTRLLRRFHHQSQYTRGTLACRGYTMQTSTHLICRITLASSMWIHYFYITIESLLELK